MKRKITSIVIAGFFMLLNNVNAQHVFVNETDINELPINFCELRVTAAILSLTKVKVYVDYGQKWSFKSSKMVRNI